MADLGSSKEEKAPYPTDESTPNLPPTKEFEPILNGPSKTNSRSNSHTRPPSLSRPLSNNGYGCDDNDDSTDDLEAVGAEVIEKDPFEVHWEDGDNDPMNPRSFSIGKKWLVVIIVSLSSFCV